MRSRPEILLLSLLVSSVVATPAHAKDLRKRIAVGFDQQLGGYPSLSGRYGLPSQDRAVNILTELDLGFAYGGGAATDDGLFIGGKLLYAFVVEDNMNLYAAGGVGLRVGDQTWFRLQPGLSAEFFFFGLENLGFSADWGLAIDLGDPSGFASFASAPGVGLHYYF